MASLELLLGSSLHSSRFLSMTSDPCIPPSSRCAAGRMSTRNVGAPTSGSRSPCRRVRIMMRSVSTVTGYQPLRRRRRNERRCNPIWAWNRDHQCYPPMGYKSTTSQLRLTLNEVYCYLTVVPLSSYCCLTMVPLSSSILFPS